MANEAPTKCCLVSGLVKQAAAIKKHEKCTEKIAIWEPRVVSTVIVLPKSALRERSRCYWKTSSNVKGQHAPTRSDKDSILAVIGSYGSHLMIVIIFVTQNNF